MINLEQVKRDVVNYGTLKVYTTFLTISEDEVDPELFNASQLKEIFNSRFDTVKINIDFVEMQEGEWVSTAKELLVFKLSKCSNNEISYMSNVDDEGKLSSLVLTKSGDEVSLEVVDYAVGGGEGHTDEEIKELAVDAVEESPSGTVSSVLGLDEGGDVVKGSLPSGGTKLYRHLLSHNTDGYSIMIVSSVSTQAQLTRDNIVNALCLGGGSMGSDLYVLVKINYQFLEFYKLATDYPDLEIDTHDDTNFTDTVTEF